jgi:hypothetical protein
VLSEEVRPLGFEQRTIEGLARGGLDYSVLCSYGEEWGLSVYPRVHRYY